MQVRVVDTTSADRKSAELFFNMLTSFYDLSDVTALDMFARTGELTVSNYYDKVKCVDVWELGTEHEETLRKYSPKNIRMGCSYQTMLEKHRQYGLVVIDSPQGIHSDFLGNMRVEHFYALSRVNMLIGSRGIVVLYVNKNPYDANVVGQKGYDIYTEYNYEAWCSARADYYGSSAITEEVALCAYRHALKEIGYRVAKVIIAPCYSDVDSIPPYAFRVALEVVREDFI